MHDTTTLAPVLPEIEESTAAALGDEILLDVARTDRVKRIKSGGTRRDAMAPQSGESRAWTKAGNVD